MSEDPKNDTVVHPADALALALERANSLLIVLMDLYETRGETFVTGNPFIVHGMSAMSELLEEARNALADLHDSCDLSLNDAKSVAVATNIVELAAKPPDVAAVGGGVPKPELKTIAAAVVTLKEADESVTKTIKSYRQL